MSLKLGTLAQQGVCSAPMIELMKITSNGHRRTFKPADRRRDLRVIHVLARIRVAKDCHDSPMLRNRGHPGGMAGIDPKGPPYIDAAKSGRPAASCCNTVPAQIEKKLVPAAQESTAAHDTPRLILANDERGDRL